ncbi:flagellar biosynthesis anti-sigma factor FlgM [Colwellia sp. 4_MG-2023]|jgi:negative regulator of flagellin synthesis FlgM|uniref:flagellar biosynthesis anti-sigma factor FlgM n=1 Tax=unclassified Colwellia TaxID=196834 RepID=UPI001C0A0A68|nr:MULTISPECIES: flagellar biosynthesis anti-sigma factor FlgM [unclassified Colwellia]MBU2923273.1 flagellar biosynthesis anti-sigma factor FlgM [Colwellia sp. C2M11]MDO6489394.1 flagellar biosynthesis anti-sigma factor FlgM [Colwellia sp. 6_MG-2023]MDO6506984.1 flagellar biosynthesis anti-sigma factor FlgM [Colwellia sp. 5_MG-2023]MDO6557180.1 flagellar biosynthesis anti-sigma factor FlgM [Colwellia sp. 4_MG-2023]MDO6654006.1 flagellar biosynthesis anti-sigma factor FlgM [Colwellia sp. 3_MG-
MTININNLNNQAQINQNKQSHAKQDVAQTTAHSPQTKHVARDSVSLTPQAQQFKELQKKSADAPVINQEKIEELKKTIASGEYKIDPQKLAASMAKFEFTL